MGNQKFEILLKATLDQATGDIKTQINQLGKKLADNPIKLNVEFTDIIKSIDTTIKEINKRFETLHIDLGKQINVNGAKTQIEQVAKDISKLGNTKVNNESINSVISSVDKLEQRLMAFKDKKLGDLSNFKTKNEDLLFNDADLQAKVKRYEQAVTQMNTKEFSNPAVKEILNQNLQSIKNIVEEKRVEQKVNEETITTQQKIAQATQREAEQQENLNRKIKDFQTAQKVETSRITGKYTGLYNKADIENYYNELKKLSTINPNEAVKKFESLRTELKRIEVNAKNSGNAIKSTMQDAISPTQALLNNLSKFGVKILLLYSNV